MCLWPLCCERSLCESWVHFPVTKNSNQIKKIQYVMKADFDMHLDFGLWHLCDRDPGWYLKWAMPGPPGCVFWPLCFGQTKNIWYVMKFDLDFYFGFWDFEYDCERSFVTSMSLWLTLSLCLLHEDGEKKMFCTCESLHHCALICVPTVAMDRLLVWLNILRFLLDFSED